MARAALLAENPDIATLGDPHQGRDPPLTALLAARLVRRGDDVHDLLARYLAALDDLDHDNDDLPF